MMPHRLMALLLDVSKERVLATDKPFLPGLLVPVTEGQSHGMKTDAL